MTALPTDDFDSLSDWAASHHLGRSCGVGAALNAFRLDLGYLLAEAAAGRREYAANAPEASAVVLEQEADTLDAVIRLMRGDMSEMTRWLPSWRWTDEMTAALELKEN